MKKLKELVKSGKAKETADRVKELLDSGVHPETMLKEALIPAMDDVGDLFQKGELYVPEMMVAARAMEYAMNVLKPVLVQGGIDPIGKVILGTVKGDLHDIGKNLVASALEGAGLEVVDLGTDVSPEQFVAAVREHQPQVLGMSALLTTTMVSIKDTIDALAEAGVRDVRVMIGGAPITDRFAGEVGADFYGPDSTAGRNFAREVATGKR
jgi:5-methyltetrahydrofolate--homocysteine methyltransferase